MFDIGFSEMVVVAVVALIVIGPERLPKAARTLGHLFGRLQRYVNDVKSDINRELELDELRKMQREVQAAARDLETSVSNAARSVETEVRSVESQLNTLAQADTAQAAASEPITPELPVGDAASAPAADTGTAVATTQEPSRQAPLPGFEQP